jgi:PhnB protein
MQLNPYLNFNGKCKEAFAYYERVFGGKIDAMIPMKDAPPEAEMAPGMEDNILHACIKIGNVTVMASDCPQEYYEAPQGISINIGVEDPAEAERIFNALAEGGQVKMALEKTFWAQKFGMVTDKFGTPWMINCE